MQRVESDGHEHGKSKPGQRKSVQIADARQVWYDSVRAALKGACQCYIHHTFPPSRITSHQCVVQYLAPNVQLLLVRWSTAVVQILPLSLSRAYVLLSLVHALNGAPEKGANPDASFKI